MKLECAGSAYLHALRYMGYAEGTINYHACYLKQFFEFLMKQGIQHITSITPQLIDDYQVKISNSPCVPSTIESKVMTLRCFFHFLFEREITFADLSQTITLPKSSRRLPKSVLTQKEVLKVLSLPNTATGKGVRDKAILEILYSTAIRRAELVGLNLYDFDENDAILKVLGKGKKERIVPIGEVALFWLKKYLKGARYFFVSDPKDQAVFISLNFGKRMRPEAVTALVQLYGKMSKINKPISPHTFRHSCATHMLKNGADIRYIQKMLGHQSVKTTQIYTHLDITDLRTVFQNTHPRAKKIGMPATGMPATGMPAT